MLTRVTAAIERNETRLEDQDRREAIQLEWKQVALVCDRTLLLVFFVVTTVAIHTITVLVVVIVIASATTGIVIVRFAQTS